MKKYIEYLLSIPKSLYFCLRVLPFRSAISIPVFVRYNVKLLDVSGHLVITGGVKLDKSKSVLVESAFSTKGTKLQFFKLLVK